MIAVPSWVIPGTYRENLAFLADKPQIQGVELLFFIWDSEVNALLSAELPDLQGYASRFTFTAHLPDVLQPEHTELVQALSPYIRHCVLHPGPRERAETQARIIRSWIEQFGPQKFLLENTGPGCLEEILPRVPPETPLCMDTGHLLLEGKSPAEFFERYRGRIQEIHLHRVDHSEAAEDRRLPDHRPIRPAEPWFQALAPGLAGFAGVINLEVFSWREAELSLAALGIKSEALPRAD
ncbi:MAG: AP endonuclease [Spirochaetaceae bacterium]|jgi:hypothetical protein|nr:AP endonuclease [Spirochaetaceae bacterium]